MLLRLLVIRENQKVLIEQDGGPEKQALGDQYMLNVYLRDRVRAWSCVILVFFRLPCEFYGARRPDEYVLEHVNVHSTLVWPHTCTTSSSDSP
jgi:hypothetical protein